MMSYRFKTSSDLDGHAVGNLILTAMLNITGSLKESIASLSKILDVRHTVLPISEDSDLTLMGLDEHGNVIEGEEEITMARRQFEKIYYKEEPKVLPEVLTALKEADLIIFSMGSLYTSVLPNVMCKEVKAVLKEAKAPIMYLCNVVTQPGETDDFTVSDHVKLLNRYLGKKKIGVLIANNGLALYLVTNITSTEIISIIIIIITKNTLKIFMNLDELTLLKVLLASS